MGCAIAALLLSGAITERVRLVGEADEVGAVRPPVRPAPVVFPTTLDECVDGGWRDFPQFADEAACTDYVDGLSP